MTRLDAFRRVLIQFGRQSDVSWTSLDCTRDVSGDFGEEVLALLVFLPNWMRSFPFSLLSSSAFFLSILISGPLGMRITTELSFLACNSTSWRSASSSRRRWAFLISSSSAFCRYFPAICLEFLLLPEIVDFSLEIGVFPFIVKFIPSSNIKIRTRLE